MSIRYDGPGNTVLLFRKEVDGSLSVALHNDNWSIVPGREYNTIYEIDGQEYTGSKSTGVTEHALVDTFEPEFEYDFAAGSSLVIYLDYEVIDRLSLRGSTKALALLNRCQRELFNSLTKAEQEDIRWKDIPKDPFSKIDVPAPSPSNPHPPRSKFEFGARVVENYPAQAIREEMEGSVSITLAVEADGSVSGCEVTTSSGYDLLDTAACESATRYGSFFPATDENGAPTQGVFSTTITYRMR